MADIAGARTTGNITQGQRRIDIQPEILQLDPNSTALTVLANLLDSKPTTDPKYQHYEKPRLARFDAVNNGAGYNTTATSIVVDNGAYFQANDLVKNTRTAEVFRVTSISTNTLTVERALDNSGTGVAMNDNDELMIIGSAFPENATSRTAVSMNAVAKTNYTQIFRDPVEMSRTQMQSQQYTTPQDWVLNNRDNAWEHAISKETAFWVGKASENLSHATGPLRTTGGVLSFVTSNVTDAGGTFTESEWNTVLRVGSRYQDDKVAFASGIAIGALQGYPAGKLQVVDQARQQYGLDVQVYQSFFGRVRLVWNKLWDASAVYSGYLVGLDARQLKYRYLSNDQGSSDTHVRQNIQTPDQDGRKDEILSECGIQVPEEKKIFLVTGITG